MKKNDIFYVEAILDHKIVKQSRGKEKLEYLVKWEGFGLDENTWETESNLQQGCEHQLGIYKYQMKMFSQEKNMLSLADNKEKLEVRPGSLSGDFFDNPKQILCSQKKDGIIGFYVSWHQQYKQYIHPSFVSYDELMENKLITLLYTYYQEMQRKYRLQQNKEEN